MNLSRFLGLDAEKCLTNAVEKFINRFAKVEFLAVQQQLDLKQTDHETLESLYQQSKRHLSDNQQIREVTNYDETELSAAVAEQAGLSKKDAEKAVSTVLDVIVEALEKGEKVQLVGFGTFEVRERAARTGKNPRTGETIEIAASKVPAFKPGQAMKNRLN